MKLLNYTTLFLCILIISSCGNKTTYKNTCKTSNFISVGVGKVFVPNIFTPNNDNMNDAFGIIPAMKIKAIVNVKIKKNNGNLISTIDTMFGATIAANNKSWLNNATIPHAGDFQAEFTAIDSNNTSTTQIANSSSYNCNNKVITLTNLAKCQAASSYDPVTGLVIFPSNDPCLK